MKPLCLCQAALGPGDGTQPGFLSLLSAPVSSRPSCLLARVPPLEPAFPVCLGFRLPPALSPSLACSLHSPVSPPLPSPAPRSAPSITPPGSEECSLNPIAFLCLSWALPPALSRSSLFLCLERPIAQASNSVVIATVGFYGAGSLLWAPKDTEPTGDPEHTSFKQPGPPCPAGTSGWSFEVSTSHATPSALCVCIKPTSQSGEESPSCEKGKSVLEGNGDSRGEHLGKGIPPATGWVART